MLEKIVTLFGKVNNKIIWFLKIIITILFSGMAISLFLAVFSRYVIQMPITGAGEIARYLMVWIAFLAGSIGIRHGVHVGLSFLLDHVSQDKKNWITLVGNTSVLIFFCFVTYYGFQMVKFVSKQTSPAMGIPMGWIYLSVAVGGFLFILFLIQSILENISAIVKSRTE